MFWDYKSFSCGVVVILLKLVSNSSYFKGGELRQWTQGPLKISLENHVGFLLSHEVGGWIYLAACI